MAMKPRKMRGGGMVKKDKAAVKKMRGGGMVEKPEMMKKGGVSVADIRRMAKDKGYKLVKE